jgi:hypothetical protein
LLACIGQTVAAAAREISARSIQNRHPTSTASAVAIHRTDEPRTSSAKVTVRPSDGYSLYSLYDRLPLGRIPAPCPIDQNHRIALRAHPDIAGRLSIVRPRTRKVLTISEPTFAMPATHVDRLAGLAASTSTISSQKALERRLSARRPRFEGLCQCNTQNYVRFLGYSGREVLAVRFSHFDARPNFCVTTRECATDKSGSGLSAMLRPVWT